MKRSPRLGTALLVLATLLAYARSLGNGFVAEDGTYIVSNPFIGKWLFLWRSLFHDVEWFRDPEHLPHVFYYRPLVDIWFGGQYQLFGLHPMPWHASMLALHLLAVWMVFKIALRLTDSYRAAWLAALFFAISTVNSQAVMYNGAIPELLCTIFALSALYLLMQGTGRSRLLALGCYALALLSYEMAMVFPAIVFAYVFLLEPVPELSTPAAFRDALWPRLLRAILTVAPFVIEVLLYLVIRKLVLGFVLVPTSKQAASHFGVAFATAPRLVATYLLLLAAPWLASPAHPLIAVKSVASPGFYLPMLALGALGAALVLWLRHSPRRRLYLFCWIWIAICVAPALNVSLLTDHGPQDRYLYLPSVAWWAMLADCATRLGQIGARARTLVWTGAAALAAASIVALFRISAVLHDDLALYSRCVKEAPESAGYHAMFGIVLGRQGDLPGAERELGTAARLDPQNGDVLFQLGEVHAQLGRIAQGTQEVAEAIRLRPNSPPYAYIVLAQLYDLNGESAKSESLLRYTETMTAGRHAASLARAQILMSHGDIAGAAAILRDLTRLYPDDYRAWNLMGQNLAAQAQNDGALEAYKRAIGLAPGDPAAHLAIAQLLHTMSRDREAINECRLTLALAPHDSRAQQLAAQIEASR